jgi:hypothetical protein
MPRSKKTGPRQQTTHGEPAPALMPRVVTHVDSPVGPEAVIAVRWFPSVMPTCGNCRAFVPDADPAKPGTCHRHAPVAAVQFVEIGQGSRRFDGVPLWPEVALNEGCWEGIPKPMPPAPPETVGPTEE